MEEAGQKEWHHRDLQSAGQFSEINLLGYFFLVGLWESSLAGVYRLHEIFIEGVGARFLQQSFTRLRWFSVQCKHRQAYSTLIAWH